MVKINSNLIFMHASNDPLVEYTFTVSIPQGLHARPCAKIVELLTPYQPIFIQWKDKKIELSVLELLLLKLNKGASFGVCATNALPKKITHALEKILENYA